MGTNDERIPRPIAGTPDGGEIQWSREYDVQTYGDLIQVGLKGETRDGDEFHSVKMNHDGGTLCNACPLENPPKL
jgi:hypothetical protein